MKNIFIYCFYILLFTACKNNIENKPEITNFDISPNGDFIVYSYINSNNISNLYMAKIDGSDINLLVSKNNYSFFCPKITKDGKTIFFIGSDERNMESSIWKFNVSKTSFKKILTEKGFISEITLSKFHNNILYIKADYYKSYSPIAGKRKHDFDIYSMNIDTIQPKKISALNAYTLSNLIELDENKIIIGQRGSDTENGIFFFNKKFIKELKKIETINDTLSHSSGYSNPVAIDSTTLICASYFKLVKINLDTKLEKRILPSNGYHFRQINYNKKLKRIFYIKRDDSNKIYSININGKDYKVVILK